MTISADKRLLDIHDLRQGMVLESDPLLRDVGVYQFLTTRKYIRVIGQHEDQVVLGITEAGKARVESVKVSLGN